MQSYFDQHSYDIKLEWGLQGLKAIAHTCQCIVVVDVMSFSTCVSIATDRGATIFPFPWKDERAVPYGAEKNALVASIKRRFGDSGYSLSPNSLTEIPQGTRLVLPSPNGSTCVFAAKDLGVSVAVGCLRNAAATADYCKQFNSIGVIACGEQWAGHGGLRVALEDAIGAGAIIASLRGRKSPEAQLAEQTFLAAKPTLMEVLQGCSSGYELRERGFADDVHLCAELDVSHRTAVLFNDDIRAAS